VRGKTIDLEALAPDVAILARRVSDLAFMLGAGFTITPADVTALDLAALRVLKDEEAKRPNPPAPPNWTKIG
jgi:hypothetical protein